MPVAELPPKHPHDQPIRRLDGADLLAMIGAGFAWLKQHGHVVNALNVFPVPDGDTGTNMVLTMQAAWKAALEALHVTPDTDTLPENASADLVAKSLASGAVRGARGNSGVILSQILRGFAEHLRGHVEIDASTLAAAFHQAKETAYRGVLKPVEGTILTVIREVSEACGHAAAISDDIRFIFRTITQKAQQALANTPNLLPVLKQAGVVDAGGQGLYYLLEGMTRYLGGERMPAPDRVTMGEAPTAEPILPQPDLSGFQDEWGYDIQYLIYGAQVEEEAVRARLLELGGESVVVGRAGSVLKVHVHGSDPGPFLSYGASLGQLDDIVLENMTLQTLRRKGQWREDAPTAPAQATAYGPECPSVVVVVSGEGLRRVFASLGVCAFVSGGQTMNPSAEELAQAAERVPGDEVIILPNNKNIILAARQAADLCHKRVHVVETRSLPQGIAAMLAFNAHASMEQNVRNMARAAQAVKTGEITTAVREACFDDTEVKPGDIIGLYDGQLVCRGNTPEEAVYRLLELMDAEDEAEIFTLYYGQPVTSEQAEALRVELEARYPDRVIEMLAGDQPYYHYLIAVE
ncbi:MAG: DAK2 domain-containing protein [Caldilineales bacterium]|nr:DAK2 domain-containing protein [Caldilineales bacterium]